MTTPRNLGTTLGGHHDGPALIDLSGEPLQRYSFTALNGLTDGFAAQLAIQRGQRVGILAANSAAFVAALFGVMRAGGIAVPINTRFPDDTIGYVTSDAELAAVYADPENINRLAPELGAKPLAEAPSAQFETVQPNAGEAGLILYTSGSTGQPKGVELSHDSQWSMVDRLAGQLAGATGIIAAPLYHMNGLLFLMMLLSSGGTVVLMPRFDARRYLLAVHEHKVNVLTGVPTMLALMAREKDLVAALDLSSVAAIQIGSAPLSETVINLVKELFPNARLSNGYGTTEAGAGMFGGHPDGVAVPSVSLGYPQPHVEVRLVGGASADEGVLEVKTPAAMNGYLNQPEKTAAKLSDDGWVNTGDVMRTDGDGFFYFVGRDDDMFVCGGENVYPGAIERVLERDARITECCVVPVADDVRGHMPVAFVVPVTADEIDEAEVKTVALAGAPAYMHPRHVLFLDRMPLAGTNKIDRQTLTTRANDLLANVPGDG
jgi:acyl-CoA synthetase (AMP-forming)/AMP-acid ligase II